MMRFDTKVGCLRRNTSATAWGVSAGGELGRSGVARGAPRSLISEERAGDGSHRLSFDAGKYIVTIEEWQPEIH